MVLPNSLNMGMAWNTSCSPSKVKCKVWQSVNACMFSPEGNAFEEGKDLADHLVAGVESRGYIIAIQIVGECTGKAIGP
jgi:hypothetical protein